MDLKQLAYPALITLLAMLLYFGLSIGVGVARVKYGIKAPQITGNEAFERAFRAHQNTLEQLAFFLPCLWLFAIYNSPLWSGILGGAWLVGRIAYAWGYYVAAEKRALGNAIASLATLALLFGAGWGVVTKLITQG